jgi:hypothetical protein
VAGRCIKLMTDCQRTGQFLFVKEAKFWKLRIKTSQVRKISGNLLENARL